MVNRGSNKNMAIKNKKGIFFTTLVIVILSLFILTSTFYSQVKERKSITKRVETLNNFVLSVEKDLPRQLKTTSFRIIFLLEKRIIETGAYVTNLNAVFDEMFSNATINGETNTEIQTLMEGATIPEIEATLKQKAEKINADLMFQDIKISLNQVDPWNIETTFDSNLTIVDKSDLVLWNKSLSIKILTPIEDFEDPLYLINTNALVTNKMIQTPDQNFVTGTDISVLFSHSQNSYYVTSTTAPNFLNRLEGTISADQNGIESLVNLQKLSSQGISAQDKSVVDYIYFDSSNNPPACNVLPSGMPSWFKLDNAHLTKYEVTC